jgi:hypothetical protein
MDKKEHTVKEGTKVTLPYIVYLISPTKINEKPMPQPAYSGKCLLIDDIEVFDKDSVLEAIAELEAKTIHYVKKLDETVEASEGSVSFTGLEQKNNSFGFLLNHIFEGRVRQVIYKKISHSEFKHLKYNLELQFLEIDIDAYLTKK